jgi:hypothetical protein
LSELEREMLKNMVTILVVGNGFDKQCGLRSSFKDFYESEFWPKKHNASSDELKNLLIDDTISCWFGLLEYQKYKHHFSEQA